MNTSWGGVALRAHRDAHELARRLGQDVVPEGVALRDVLGEELARGHRAEAVLEEIERLLELRELESIQGSRRALDDLQL